MPKKSATNCSKKWKQRFGAYLRKEIFQGAVIRQRLSEWLANWTDVRDSFGRAVLLPAAKKVTEDQASKVERVSDPPGIDMYTRVPAGPRSPHGLPTWSSDRAESKLEKAHEYLAHCANTLLLIFVSRILYKFWKNSWYPLIANI